MTSRSNIPSRRSFLHTIGTLVGSLPHLRCSDSQQADRPNIVLFFIDDLGYADIEPFGSKQNQTPNLNRLASMGMRLTSFYVAAPLCSPSRAALMTGCYPARVGLEKGSRYGVLLPGDPHGINLEETTLPEILQAAGYSTACMGKWHLGDQPEFMPTRHGFDYYYGIPYSNDMWPRYDRWNFPPLPVLRNEEVVGEIRTMTDQAELTRNITEEAISFIKRNSDGPFFLYLPHAMVHWPHAATSEFADRSPDDAYKAAVEEIDWSVGRVMQTLEDLNLDQNTLFIFTSDNGGAKNADNTPLRGYKGTTWEGGMRVPTIAKWPGKVPAGSVCDEIASTLDFLPTFARLVDAEVPQDHPIDGHDMSALLMATPGAKSEYKTFYYQQDAVRSGGWKLFGNGQLYNLQSDVGEKKDVADQNPEVVARLERLLEEGRRDLSSNGRPVGKAKGPLRFLIPRPGGSEEESNAPVRQLK